MTIHEDMNQIKNLLKPFGFTPAVKESEYQDRCKDLLQVSFYKEKREIVLNIQSLDNWGDVVEECDYVLDVEQIKKLTEEFKSFLGGEG